MNAEAPIRFRLNGREVSASGDPLRRLLDVLREDFGLTGVKEGCGEGECGACAVLIDGRLVNSCLVPVGDVEGRSVLTVEGFRETDRYRAIAAAMEETGAVQCGFCTPGFILSAYALLIRTPNPTEEEILTALEGNICRCTGYAKILEAVQLAAERMRSAG